MALLPPAVRRLVPNRVRDDVRVRAVAVGLGLIPPRTMHSEAEARLLARLAAPAQRVVEIGVYEGSSAVVLARAMGPGTELHLIDPFGRHPQALPAGWGATEWASRRVVARAAASGPAAIWHIERSEETAAAWAEPVDLVFIDGDHSHAGCERDWRRWGPLVRPGGLVAFHDARLGQPGGRGLPGPTAVVDGHLRAGAAGASGWEIIEELDRTVVARRHA
ncbi:MAG: class I SAM-dependent methyltransferase [Actinobacteria bacterium]|nr:MAG: class I SAM-dependent methyltransferase [Actinomycetota bacterium]